MTRMDTELLPKEGLVLCAVSGGADSMYLLVRLRELGFPVAAAHYNHGLRGEEADRDEAFVRDFCAGRDIPFVAEKGDVRAFAAQERLGLEEAGRRLRYDFLERAADELGAAAIATAHTADDNAETLLLRLARGTGLRGLGGIPPRRGRVVRPMLGVSRREIEAYLRENDIPHVEDATNREDSYARNRVRHGAVPALETVDPAFVSAAGQTAWLLRQDEAFLTELARNFLAANADENSVDAKALLDQPWPVASRAVRLMAGRELSLAHVRAVLKAARDGGAADVPGLRAARNKGRLVFGAENAPQLPERELAVPGRTPIPEAGLTVLAAKFTHCTEDVHKSYNIFSFQCENIYGSITVAGRRPGDSFRPAGRNCTKTLKKLFLEAGIPPWERDAVPVLRDERGILGVYGLGADQRVCAKPGDREILRIEFRPEPDEGG